MGYADKVKNRAYAAEYRKKHPKPKKVFSGIVARGGDQHQPLPLCQPKRSVSELRRELNALLKSRPSNLDIPAITEWALKKESIETDLTLHGVMA